MKRLVIAIDCDDVLIPATEYLVNTYNEQYGTAVQLKNAYMSRNLEWQAERDEVFRRLYALQSSPGYATIKPDPMTIEKVRQLAESHELHLVTARDESVMEATRQMLDAYYPGCFTTVEHVGPNRQKGEVCRAVAADVIVDDNLHHLVSARECGVTNLIWFGDYPWQDRTVEQPEGTLLCNDWDRVGAEIERIAA